jgi:hypothetical protein
MMKKRRKKKHQNKYLIVKVAGKKASNFENIIKNKYLSFSFSRKKQIDIFVKK